MNSEIFAMTFEEELYRIPLPVTVVLGKPWHAVTQDEQLLLTKILGAVKQSLNAVTILHVDNPVIGDFPDGSRTLSFGPTLSPTVAPYTIHRAGNSVFIQADPLSVLEPDAAKKKELWTAMKQAFL